MNINAIQSSFNTNLLSNKATLTNPINMVKHNTSNQDSFNVKSFDTFSFGNRYRYDYRATIDLKNAKTAEDVRWALSRGADPNGIDDNSVPVLHSLVLNGTTGALKELIKAGANLDITDKDGETASMLAEKCNRQEALHVLTEAKENISSC